MPRTPAPVLRCQPLEPRDAPATLAADGKTVTYRDADGDSATVVLSKPVLTQANVGSVFTFDSLFGENVSQQLRTIDLTGLPAGMSVTVKATQAGGGDGFVDVGWVKADGKDLGTVTVAGDLGRVTAGDTNTRTAGLKALAVGSLGARGLATQAAGGSLLTAVAGNLGKLAVAGAVAGARVAATGNIGPVTIGGSLTAHPTDPETGLIDAAGNIGPVKIGGSVTGDGGHTSGLLARRGNIGPVTIGGDLRSGAGEDSAAIRAIGEFVGTRLIGGRLTSVTVTGDVEGTARGGAAIYGYASIGRVQLKSLTGGAGINSGSVRTFLKGIGPVVITGDVTGGDGQSSAYIGGGSTIASVTIDGTVTGRGGLGSAQIFANKLGPVKIGGDLVGGGGQYSGAVSAGFGVTSVTVGRHVQGGPGKGSASISTVNFRLGPVKIGGDLVGDAGHYSASISGGQVTSVQVTGKVQGGAGDESASVVGMFSVGPVSVRGDWTGASIVAGIPIDIVHLFNPDNPDDTLLPPARIAGITIGGTLSGSAAAGDSHVFLASHIQSLKVVGNPVVLEPGAKNDDQLIGTDFWVVET